VPGKGRAGTAVERCRPGEGAGRGNQIFRVPAPAVTIDFTLLLASTVYA